MKYTKPALSITDQLQQLSNRGLTISDPARAHHSRVWNRKFVKTPVYPRRTSGLWLSVPIGEAHRNKSYLLLCSVNYLLKAVNPSSSFSKKLKTLLGEHPSIPIHYMGFPPAWDTDDFWT